MVYGARLQEKWKMGLEGVTLKRVGGEAGSLNLLRKG